VSAEALLWAVEQRVGDAHARFLLLILAGAADEWGSVDFSPARIAEWTEMTPLELLHAFRRLRAGGWISGAGALRLRMWEE
jgi:CRP-like cAMP-binding protein